MSKINFMTRIYVKKQLYNQDIALYKIQLFSKDYYFQPINLSRYKIKLIKIHSC